MKNIKNIGYGTITWLVIFVINYIYELFKINESGTIVTLTGLKITTLMTEKELYTEFSLTKQALVMYIGFIICWVIVCYFIYYRKKSK